MAGYLLQKITLSTEQYNEIFAYLMLDEHSKCFSYPIVYTIEETSHDLETNVRQM
jgi:hypothetical protein